MRSADVKRSSRSNLDSHFEVSNLSKGELVMQILLTLANSMQRVMYSLGSCSLNHFLMFGRSRWLVSRPSRFSAVSTPRQASERGELLINSTSHII